MFQTTNQFRVLFTPSSICAVWFGILSREAPFTPLNCGCPIRVGRSPPIGFGKFRVPFVKLT